MVGDAEQLQAIDAGGAFRALRERHGAVEITEIRRQGEKWQRAATRDFAQSYTEEALTAYRDRGHVHPESSHSAARELLVQSWSASRLDSPGKTQIMMAFTRHDVHELNQAARATYRQEGRLVGDDLRITTAQGERSFATGDRIYFLKNDVRLGVMNGSLGTLAALDQTDSGTSLKVTLDDGRSVTFSTADYEHFSHGYAATVHKAQGATVDKAYLLASRYMDRHSTYVGMSRHRERVDLYYGEDEFRSFQSLSASLGRDRRKDTTLDYLHRAEKTNEVESFWDKVRGVLKPRPKRPAPRLMQRLALADAKNNTAARLARIQASLLRDVIGGRVKKRRYPQHAK